MRKYDVQVPVFINFRSAYDTHDFDYSHEVEYETRSELDGAIVNISISGKEGVLEFQGLEAESENDALRQALELITIVSNLSSLEIQIVNRNSHYGHPFVDWEPGKIAVTPKDRWPSEQFSLTGRQLIDTSSFNQRLAKVRTSPVLSFLLSASAASFSSVDYRTKFFNAFLVLEYIEDRYAKCIGASQLLEDSIIDQIIDGVEQSVAGKDSSVASNVISRVRSTLKRMTKENRAMKLTRIVNDVFRIRSLEYSTGPVEVHEDFIRKLIAHRNELFHARPVIADRYVVPEQLKRVTDLTVMLSMNVVKKLIDHEVPIFVDGK